MYQTIKKIKKLFDHVFTAILLIFLLAFIFVPFHYLVLYGIWVIRAFFIIIPLWLVLEIYIFMKETPERRRGQKRVDTRKLFGMKRKTFFSILQWAGLIIVLIVLLNLRSGNIGSAECPDIIQGNQNANLKIKYFYTPFCPSCWRSEPFLNELVKKQGDLFSIEKYDIRYCTDITKEYKIYQMPSYVFILQNESEESVNYGFITKDKFEEILFDLTRG